MIESNRLNLRYLKDDDLESVFYNWANDDDVCKFLTWPAHKTLDDTRKIFEYWKSDDINVQKYNYFVELKETNELIGECGVVRYDNGIPEIGYVFGKKWWNKGYATEACKKVIEILFKDGFDKILIKSVKENIASNKVIQKCGFKYIREETNYYGATHKKEMTCFVFEINKKVNNKNI